MSLIGKRAEQCLDTFRQNKNGREQEYGVQHRVEAAHEGEPTPGLRCRRICSPYVIKRPAEEVFVRECWRRP